MSEDSSHQEKALIPPDTIPHIIYVPDSEAVQFQDMARYDEQTLYLRNPEHTRKTAIQHIFKATTLNREYEKYDFPKKDIADREAAELTVSLMSILPPHLHNKFWILDELRDDEGVDKLAKVICATDEASEYLYHHRSADKKILDISNALWGHKEHRDEAVSLLSSQERQTVLSLRAQLFQEALSLEADHTHVDSSKNPTRPHELAHVSSFQQWDGVLQDVYTLRTEVGKFLRKLQKHHKAYMPLHSKLAKMRRMYEYMRACGEADSIAHEMLGGGTTVLNKKNTVPREELDMRMSDILEQYQTRYKNNEQKETGIDILLSNGTVYGGPAPHEIGTLFLMFGDRLKTEIPAAGASSTVVDFVGDPQEGSLRAEVLQRMEGILKDEEYAKSLFLEGAGRVQQLFPHLIEAFDKEMDEALLNGPRMSKEIEDLRDKIKKKIKKMNSFAGAKKT